MNGKPRTMNGIWSLLGAGLFVLFSGILVPANSWAEIATLDEFKALGEKFDHLATGFALTGEHSQLDCGECHIGGVFEALPRECDACHDNVIAEGTPSNHVDTTQPCDTCHTTQGFIATAVMDHSLITGTCSSCHDGVAATGKSANHIATTNICEACHTTNFWTPALTVDHDQVLGSCINCHNGVAATGKTSNHIPSTDVCEACHFATGEAWVPVLAVDHNHVLGACSLCHDLPNGHIPIPAGQECNACHTPGGPGWAATAFDHSSLQGRTCAEAGCHDGVNSTGKPNDQLHANVTNECGACHSAGVAWTPELQVDHAQVLGLCSNCHDGTTARGKGPGHIQTTEDCGACHTPGDPTWSASTFDHSTVQGRACTDSGCHDGVNNTGKPTDQLHANVTDQCGACHSAGAAFNPPLQVDHDQVILPCQSCHDGTVATGKNTGHIATTQDCGDCHSTVSFADGAFDHNSIAQLQPCARSGCHDGVTAPGKTTNHIDTSNSCEACHQTGGSFAIILQVDHAHVNGPCSSCHTQPANHIAASNACDACHLPWPELWTNVPTVDHDQVLGDCVTCHNNNIALGKPNNHIDSSDLCSACHSTTAFAPALRVDHSQVNGSCSTCHLSEKPNDQVHNNASDICDACHTTNSWQPVARVDHTQFSNINNPTSCDICHDKSGGHPITSDNCGVCHRNFTSWNRISMDHNEVPAGSCSSCHNGVIAGGKNRGHCPTNEECDVCHTSTSSWGRTSRDC